MAHEEELSFIAQVNEILRIHARLNLNKYTVSAIGFANLVLAARSAVEIDLDEDNFIETCKGAYVTAQDEKID